jgi:thiamine transporter ThiT
MGPARCGVTFHSFLVTCVSIHQLCRASTISLQQIPIYGVAVRWGLSGGLCYTNSLPAELLNQISALTMEKAGKAGFSAI